MTAGGTRVAGAPGRLGR